MNIRFKMACMVSAFTLLLLLAGCSQTAQPSATTDSKTVAETAPAKVEAPPPEPVTIAAGTPIKIRTETTLSTKSAKTGDTFTATLAEPIVIDGHTIATRGARVAGRVADSDPGGRVKGVASISVRLTQLGVVGGDVAIKTGTVARKAKTTKRNDAVKVGVGAGIGAAIGAIAGRGTGRGDWGRRRRGSRYGCGPGDPRRGCRNPVREPADV